MVLGSIGSICALFLVVRYFCFYMVLYGIWFFFSSSFGCLIIIFIFVVSFLFYFFSVFLLPPRFFIFSFAFIQVLIHFHLFASFIGLLCVLYASVFLVSFSFPFSRSRVFAFPKFLIYHECMHDCCLEIHCALIRIAIAYYK